MDKARKTHRIFLSDLRRLVKEEVMRRKSQKLDLREQDENEDTDVETAETEQGEEVALSGLPASVEIALNRLTDRLVPIVDFLTRRKKIDILRRIVLALNMSDNELRIALSVLKREVK